LLALIGCGDVAEVNDPPPPPELLAAPSAPSPARVDDDRTTPPVDADEPVTRPVIEKDPVIVPDSPIDGPPDPAQKVRTQDGVGFDPLDPTGPRGLANSEFPPRRLSVRPAPPEEKEPSISEAERKKEIYDRYLQLSREYGEAADKLAGSRRAEYLRINKRRVKIELGRKYKMSQSEIQEIIKRGASIALSDSEISEASREQRLYDKEKGPLVLNEGRNVLQVAKKLTLDEQKAIFKDWAVKWRARLGDARKIVKESRAKAYMQLEEKRLIKEFTEKYQITAAELDQIRALGTTKNW
jgi:hypothetical protein